MLTLHRSVPIPPFTTSEFDHGDVHLATGRVFIAHTQTGTIAVLDGEQGTHLATIVGCAEASGVLVAQEANVVFAAARGSGKVLVIDAIHLTVLRKISVDPRPNGLAWDPTHQQLLVADVQNNTAQLFTLTGEALAVTPLPGRPRWCLFDRERQQFLVNIREPACLQILAAETARPIATWPINGVGPHGLDIDLHQQRAFVACDNGQLIMVDLITGQEQHRIALSGTPDAIWFNAQRQLVYVAIGEPGVIDVVDVAAMQVVQILSTESGSHTTAFDAFRQWLYVFLPTTCQADVYAQE